MSKSPEQALCGAPATRVASSQRLSLPVIAGPPPKVRKSRSSKWRAGVLIAVHVIMIAHFMHWVIAGRTLSPIEPSESMYTLNQGHLNAGFVFFAAAILATMVFGRFVCGWGCHFIAYQDLCYTLLKKIGIKAKPFRSRILVWAPFALALYMFVWPSFYRWIAGIPAPTLTNHLMKTDFWETFPGPAIAVLTVLVGGMAVVYFLGAKGFCTYACPYGGFFGLAEKIAPGRILVTDDCEHCGHCTAVCTSNVRVHEEVARFGMVVSPGCMKCMDCVSVCPNDALYFGFTSPLSKKRVQAAEPTNTKHKWDRPAQHAYDFSLWEELAMVAVGLGSLLTFRGLYDQIPLLMAMAMAAMMAFLVIKSIRLLRDANVRLQNLQLKRGGGFTRSGIIFMIAAGLLGIFTAHSAAIQYKSWRGQTHFAYAAIGDEVWSLDGRWARKATQEQRAQVQAAMEDYDWVDRWGLLTSYRVLNDMVWLHLADDQVEAAERTVRRLIARHGGEADPHRGLGGILRKSGRPEEAIAAYRMALKADPRHAASRSALVNLLLELDQVGQAREVWKDAMALRPPEVSWTLDFASDQLKTGHYSTARQALEDLLSVNPKNARAHWMLGVLLFQLQDVNNALAHLRLSVAEDDTFAEAHYDLGLTLLQLDQLPEAIGHLQAATRLKPDFAMANYNLGVALFMAKRLPEAEVYIKEAIRLNPQDPDAPAFLEVIRKQRAQP